MGTMKDAYTATELGPLMGIAPRNVREKAKREGWRSRPRSGRGGGYEWLGWHWIIAAPLSAILAYFPLLGTISGVMGAHYGWHWGWGASFALFFGPMLLILFLGLLFFRRD
jgi:hypothetical protein